MRWSNGADEPQPARLSVEADSLVLTPIGGGASREFPLDEIVAVEIRPPGEPARSATIVVTLRNGDTIELDSNVDRWIASHLLERLFSRGLGGSRRILVGARLKPGAGDRARELLRGGPPFPPEATPLVLHEAYLVGDEVVFLFDTDDAMAFEQVAEPDFWAAAGAWRDLITGEVRLAERVYSWSRDEPSAIEPPVGLGY